MRQHITAAILLFLIAGSTGEAQERSVDICIYGGSSAGVIAAYTAKMSGKSVLLIEPGKHLGGLTAGGLGFTDIGNKYAVMGLARDFYRRIGNHYGKFEQWIFEPHVAENLFNEYIKRASIEVLYEHRLLEVTMTKGAISSISLESSNGTGPSQSIKAKVFIDCTYEGDLMAKAKVSYVVGRESNSDYHETFNGYQVMSGHQFPDGIDPYRIKGQRESGLLWGISPASPRTAGSGDKMVQAYNFRICLSSDPANMIPITRPDNYDSTRYELLVRLMEKEPQRPFNRILKPDLMPNRKTDINNNGPISTDMIGENYDYPEASYERRLAIIKRHEDYTKGLLYFIATSKSLPAHLGIEMRKWGYPKDEYIDNGHWSHQPYIRESRRMVGEYVMTQANCEGKEVVKDGVGMAAYTMDSHNTQRLVINGMVKNEGNVEVGGFPPYPIAYRSLIPKRTECTNLLVPVCLSATHIAYGSIRMEPVFMVLGQSSAVAACMAIDKRTAVQDVNVAALQQRLKSDPLGDKSTPEILVDNDDASGVLATGSWTRLLKAAGAYGPSVLADTTTFKQAKSVVKYSPSVVKAGAYRVYIYCPRTAKGTTKMTVSVFNGKVAKDIVISPNDVKVEGQTSGEWISLGTHTLPVGKTSHVSVTTAGTDGIVVADAILFVPER